MNFLVFLDSRAGELEKILSGVKTMLLKEIFPSPSVGQAVRIGDSLYFLRHDECALQVKATVTRVLTLENSQTEDLSHTLKEMQARLQLTEDQYNYWSAKQKVLLVEFGFAQKTGVIPLALDRIADRSDWIAFETFNLVTE